MATQVAQHDQKTDGLDRHSLKDAPRHGGIIFKARPIWTCNSNLSIRRHRDPDAVSFFWSVSAQARGFAAAAGLDHAKDEISTGRRKAKPMRTCYLHVGTPKTGTSSIQSSLYFGLESHRFQYISFGEINSSRGLQTLFGDDALDFFANRILGLRTNEKLNAYKARLSRRLDRALRRSRRHQANIILSSERCWRMSTTELERVRLFFEGQGFRVQVIGYLRPWLGWMSSVLAQWIKYGLNDLHSTLSPGRLSLELDYTAKLHRFETVFGKANTQWRTFDRQALTDGCAVQDFFHLINAKIQPEKVARSNESLGLEACRILYAYNQCRGTGHIRGRYGFAARNWLLETLTNTLPSPSLTLHRSFFSPVWDQLQGQQQRLKNDFGIDLPLEVDTFDADHAIRTERDLLAIDPQALERLAQASGHQLNHQKLHNPEAIAEMLVDLLRTIERFPSGRSLARVSQETIQRHWRHAWLAC